jgi:hypothetical protein
MALEQQSNFEILKNLGNDLMGFTINNFSVPAFTMTGFDPSTVNVNAMPADGTFKTHVTGFPNTEIFSAGTYKVTNCLIVGDDITTQTYTWNVTNPTIDCDLVLVEFNIIDNTACDYYYSGETDYYTPVASFPNASVDDTSTIVVKYPIPLYSIKYLNTIERNIAKKRSALFSVVLGIENNICILKNHYVKNVLMPAGISLIKLLLIAIASRSSKDAFRIAYLLYQLKYVANAYSLGSRDNLGGIPISGSISLTTFSGTHAVTMLTPFSAVEGKTTTRAGTKDANGHVHLMYAYMTNAQSANNTNIIS